MKKFNLKSTMIFTLVGLLVSCGGSTPKFGEFKYKEFEIGQDVKYELAGRKAKNVYNALSATAIGDLNYLKSAKAQNAQHFANFVDGLLMHNNYGVLEKNLATKVERNEDNTEFTFTVMKKVPWVKSDGTFYKAIVKGKSVQQYVSPEDWVTTAKMVSTYQNESELQYLVGMFVKGAEEYYHYTMIAYRASQGNPRYQKMMEDDAALAKELNKLLQTNSPTIWKQQYGDGLKPITKEQVPAIKSGERFGVKADLTKNTVTYTLNMKASYFPTLFTYSCYLPSNQYFIDSIGFSNFGQGKDNLLYCGPYILGNNNEKSITYLKNPTYWNKDIVYIDQINYAIAPSEIGDDYTRIEFEEGRIDGFSISDKDDLGWEYYIKGGKNGKGTMENPARDEVNSRFLDTIGEMFGSNINLSRDIHESVSYVTGSTKESLANTARALSIQEVRQAIMASFPYVEYYERMGKDEQLQTQYLVHTYVPKGFALNDDGGDYIADNYLNVYAENKGIEPGSFDDEWKADTPVEDRTAAWYLKPGQYTSRLKTQEELDGYVERAQEAIELYNADSSHTPITYPITIEYYSAYFDAETLNEDNKVVAQMNKNLNFGVEGSTNIFHVKPTDLVTSGNYEKVSQDGAFDFAGVQWGWGADYGDPLTFMNTYRKGNGDWADIFAFVGDEYTANFKVEDGELVEENLLEEYTRLVDLGAEQTDDITARYDYFAQAEYLLIEELSFYKPQVNYGQGWALSVSLAAGYYMPSSSFGLANDRLTGMYVLTREDMLDRNARNAARSAQEADKAAYFAEHGAINIYD